MANTRIKTTSQQTRKAKPKTISEKPKEITPNKSKKNNYILAIIIFSIALLVMAAIISFFFTWKDDQSINMEHALEISSDTAKNSIGKIGALIGGLLVEKLFGVMAICIPLIILTFSMILFKVKLLFYRKTLLSLLSIMLLGAIAASYLFPNEIGMFGSSPGGEWGYRVNMWSMSLFGDLGTGFVLFTLLAIWLVYTSLTIVKCLGKSIHKAFAFIGMSINAIFILIERIFGHKPRPSKIEPQEMQKIPEEQQQIEEKTIEEEPIEVINHEENRIQENIFTTEEDFMAHREPTIDNNDIVRKVDNHSEGEFVIRDDYSQTIDRDNMILFDIEEPFIQEEIKENPEAKDDDFEITGGYTHSDDIKEEEFEISITSNAELDIDNSSIKENVIITTNEPSELDDIDNSVFDPTLELSSYKLPEIDLLDNHTSKVVVTEEELFENKNKIVETLNNFNISIDKIKATIGPTVTLYEIKPSAGVRISKIKNLEDDIALSLSALGIRIIAPIPGKGTIGIEVPNKNKETVSMYSVIKSAKFQESKHDLPIVLGRTIQNDDFVIDLAKMPHLLVAGATGQGKSVGLNAIITSLLYKKHPSELKFVMVDPKRVELTLYQNIENHFLAKMEDESEAIITDTQRVVYTLNSLCIEMDERYKLLNKAKARNIKEYNDKFRNRKLNPNNGHRFLPYFVVIIDEFADLIMTAGKEIEVPIARIAQLARAVGIHLVIATQRPTTNIITGVIKANFPARIAFRVSSMIDSRTILDQPGANQLIGRGDMLVSTGNEVTRVQCAFIDTPEVERITDYIGAQRSFGSPYILPDYSPEGDSKFNGGGIQVSGKLDEKFTEVARYVVQNQQGSASTIQRNFSIGFNRAGRLMDQLEKAGIVGKQEGSKPRQVLVSDMSSLEIILYDIENNNLE